MYYSFIVPLFSTLHTHTVHINIGIDDLLPRDRKTVSNRVKRSKSKIRTFTLRLDYRLNIRLYRHSKIRRFFVKSFELYSVFILLPSWIVNYWQEERKVERTRPNWLFEFSNLALRCCLNVLANSWHSFGTHTRYLHRLFLLRPSYIDTVINDARADVIIGFSKTSYLTHFAKTPRSSMFDTNQEWRVSSFLFFLFLSLYIILLVTLSFSLRTTKLSRSIIFVTRWSCQFARDFRFPDPSITRFCFSFITLLFFFYYSIRWKVKGNIRSS